MKLSQFLTKISGIILKLPKDYYGGQVPAIINR